MSEPRNYIEKQGLDRYAVDLSGVRIRQSQYRHEPSWFGAYTWALKHMDFESAHLIRLRNDERYAEAEAARAAEVFPLRHAEIRSLREAESERIEAA